MEKKQKIIGFCLVLTLLFGIMALPATAKELTKVRLAEVVRSVFYAPLYVAISQGLFAAEGIEIDMGTAWGATFCIHRRGP